MENKRIFYVRDTDYWKKMMWKELPFSKNLFGSEAALSNFSSFARRSSLFSISSVTFSQRSMAWKRKYIVCFIQCIKQKFILIKKILENFLIYFSSYQKIHSLPKIDFTQKRVFSFTSKNLMIPELLEILDIEKRIFVLKKTPLKNTETQKSKIMWYLKQFDIVLVGAVFDGHVQL